MKPRSLSSLIGAYMTRDGGQGKALPDFNAKGSMHRDMEVDSFDVDKRTVSLAFSSELPVERWFGFEVLDHSPSSIRLDRLRDGAPLLLNHDWDDQIGVIESVTIGDDRRGRAIVRFSRNKDADEIFQDVMDGIRRHVSVGYRILAAKLEEIEGGDDTYRIIDWEPYEISIVSVPADPSVGVGRSLEIPQEDGKRTKGDAGTIERGTTAKNSTTEEVRTMNEKILRDGKGNLVRAMVDADGKIIEVLEMLEEAGADVRNAQNGAARAERERTASILQMGTQYDCRELAEKAVAAGDTVDAFRAAVLDHINTRGAKKPEGQPAQPSQRSGTPLSEMPSPLIGLSEQEVRNYSIFRAVRALQPNASKADRDAAAFEIECSEAAQRQLGKTAQGILIPDDVLSSRAFNAGGAANTPAGAQSGQNLIDTTTAGSFIEMLRNRTTIMRLGTPMGGLVGNVDVTRQTGGATAYWVGEGENAQEGTPQIGQLELTPKTLAAYTDITRRLLKQSSPDAEGIVRRDLVNAMAQAIDYAGYYGSGAGNQPRGIKNYTGINAVDFAALWPSYAELVQMESEIAADNADIGQMGYIGNARFRGNCKTAPKFGTGTESTIWEPGNTVNGYRTEITNQIANGDVFFGNFADMLIGMWGGLDLTVDPYALSLSGGLRLVVFQDIDFVLRRVESFCWGSQNVA
ncbi:phage major capsid protein [Aeromonas veronii]|uniref:phage major capsid protein n=1 Tax=Aeromonas veronii TaxID=654 RepID=UPI00191D351C|nr:phage major capsid protein [Aeromonas veronii]MBL0492664.1 phage major capsid protein [Aeromonas veronii]